MKVANAVRKLEKHGYKVTENRGHFYATKDGIRLIEFFRNGGGEELTCIRSRRMNDQDDHMTDYFCGCWHDTITQAMKFA